jgi:hypothetical protein
MMIGMGAGLFGNGRPSFDKEAGEQFSEAEVLITVKAAPQPSAAYGDTVCVAGVRMRDEGPEWIRLYPIPFRYLDPQFKFKKYDLLRLPVKPAPKDRRSESYVPDLSKLVVEEHLPPWRKRHAYVGPLVDAFTACELNRLAKDAPGPGPSLAAVSPADVDWLELEPSGEWTADELSKLQEHLQQDTLFGASTDKSVLRKPRYKGRYRYRCLEKTCKGHAQGLLDWEFSELQRKHVDDTDEAARANIIQRFHAELCDSRRGPAFFLGNMAKREHIFSVLGIYGTKG